MLDEQWLLNSQDDPWQLISNKLSNNSSPYAFIGNGYIGQQVPPESEGMLFPQENYSQSGCFIHGLYCEQPLHPGIMDFVRQHAPEGSPLTQETLAEVPLWSTLRYHDGNAAFASNIGCHENYSQIVDMQTATIVTKDTWSSDAEHKTDISTSIYISYANRNLAVITTTIAPHFSGTVTFTDSLDGSFLAYKNSTTQVDSNETMSLAMQLRNNSEAIVIASKVVLAPKLNAKLEYESENDNHKISRKLSVKVQAGKNYSITKLVGIYTHQDGADLVKKAEQMVTAAAENLNQERKAHAAAWHELWQHRIEIEGAPGLQKLVNAALYQFYAQLRKGINWSLSPTGITGCGQWAGIIFWDADLWMGPPLALLNPPLARSIFQYRHKTLAGAKQNATAKDYKGARFAWESTMSGIETCYAYTAEQPHIVADIALTQWQYYLISGDESYRAKATEVILACAEYWHSRVIYNQEQNRYEIMKVCCADEYSGIVNNNTYTNYSAVKTLIIASNILQQQGKSAPAEWQEIITKMYLPFDPEQDLYLEHENYAGATIKQADTALLIYPYEMPMTAEQKQNILEYYRKKYPKNKIMMSSAFDAICYCEQKQPEKAWQALLELLPHFSTPFLAVSESPTNNVASFMTGLGGLLQLIINGFCGVRISTDATNESQPTLKFKTCLPQQIKSICLKGIHFQGQCFDHIAQ